MCLLTGFPPARLGKTRRGIFHLGGPAVSAAMSGVWWVLIKRFDEQSDVP